MDSCRLLPSVRGRQPDPRVQLFISENQVKETVPVRCNRWVDPLTATNNLSRNPVFEQGFLILVPGNASHAELKVKIS